ncbi:MAG: MBL fold metallo-hydrolase [Candidatus Heimdallarchaeota archaeon]|nr:MBL fold metallo-hydrolase [Candidatus Heimdallarchaeota archaeon]
MLSNFWISIKSLEDWDNNNYDIIPALIMALEEVKVRILVDNSAGMGSLFAETGFSAYIELYDKSNNCMKFLFDTGSINSTLEKNVTLLSLDLSTLDMIILSHGHWDHVAGLKYVRSKLSKKIPLVCHPNALLSKKRNEGGLSYEIGLPKYYDIEELHRDFEVISTDEPFRIFEGAVTSGLVPRKNDFELVTGKLTNVTIFQNDNVVMDPLVDDLSLFFKIKDSLIILTGCCHAGIINTIHHAKTLFPELTHIRSIIGGLHLYDASKDRIDKTIQELTTQQILSIAPCHCTGIRGQAALYDHFQVAYKEVGVGSILEFS